MRRLASAVLAVLASAACGGAMPERVELPPAKDAIPERTIGQVDAIEEVAITSEEVTFQAEGREIPGTIVHPTKGTWPAVLLMAGSGPTDRDWNSKLLPGKNGSSKLLAEAVARHGAVVLRFDKALTGKNTGPALDKLTLDTYLEEARGGLAMLRLRKDVDADHVFVAGHSEGGLHAIRVAQAEGGHVAGLLLLSTPGSSMKDLLVKQIAGNLRDGAKLPPEQVKSELAMLSHTLDEFVEAHPVDPTQASTIPQLQQLVAGLIAPQTAPLLRALMAFDPASTLAKINQPTFIFNGLKDVQVDPQADAGRLEQVRRDAGRDVTLFLAPDANHILEHETLPLAKLRGDLVATQAHYNAADRVIDKSTVAAIVGWLARQTAPVAKAKGRGTP